MIGRGDKLTSGNKTLKNPPPDINMLGVNILLTIGLLNYNFNY